ncbi:hypothetical protein H6227_002581, partial [Enterococcus faecalis]|nr:hypothetical protein [Enterococcus faecalis]
MNKKMKKQIKCTKKKLAVAAIAMIVSGSLVPTSVSLAESNTMSNQESVKVANSLLQLNAGSRALSSTNSQSQLVGSFEELKQAFANPYIKEVILTQNIYMTQTLNPADIKNPDLLINGSYNGQ